MRKREIDRKLDEIIDFSGVERYIDTPVKRYSSGMYVRLAFAVAAHLESEILIVDEVLAVGDAEFQKKCLGKMGEVSKGEGRTVLFVSHNMAAVKSLCNQSIILQNGSNFFIGDVMDGISKYISFDQQNQIKKNSFQRSDFSSKKVFIESVIFFDDQTKDLFQINLKIIVQANLESKAGINIILYDGMGFPIAFGCSNYRSKLYELCLGKNEIIIKTQPLYLGIGSYKISIELVDPGYEYFDVIEDAIHFDISSDELANRNYGILQSWGKGSIELLIH
jgi:lipopolysaccharide transport system ATP-binding protein